MVPTFSYIRSGLMMILSATMFLTGNIVMLTHAPQNLGQDQGHIRGHEAVAETSYVRMQ